MRNIRMLIVLMLALASVAAAQGGTIGGGGIGSPSLVLTPKDSIRFTGTASAILGGTGNMSIQAGTGASRTLTLKTTTSAGAVKNALVLAADSSAVLLGATYIGGDLSIGGAFGTANQGRIYTTANAWNFDYGVDSDRTGAINTTGYNGGTTRYRSLFIQDGKGTNLLKVNASASPTIELQAPVVFSAAVSGITTLAGTSDISGFTSLTGGAGNFTLTAGTGNSRTLTLQTTTSAGTAKNTLVLGADSSTTFLGTAAIPDSVRFTNAANIRGGAGDMVILAGTGNSRTITMQGTNGSGTATGLCIFSAVATIGFVCPSVSIGTANGAGGSPTFTFNSDVDLGLYRAGADTLGISAGGAGSMRFTGGANPVMLGQAGNMTIQAGTGNSRTLTLQGTDAGGVARNGLVVIDSQTQVMSGRAGKPSLTFSGDTDAGFILPGGGIVSIVDGGSEVFRFDASGSPPTLSSQKTDDFRILAGSGNNRDLILASSNSAGTATTFASGSGDTLRLPGHAIFSGLTAASGTPNSVCQDATSKQILENAASSCVVSSRRFKENIKALSVADALARVTRLQASAYNYRNGGRTALGLIAEDVARIDPRLVSYDAQRRPNSVNYEQVTVLLLSVVQEQQRRIEALERANRSDAALGNPWVLLAGIGAFGLAAAARAKKVI